MGGFYVNNAIIVSKPLCVSVISHEMSCARRIQLSDLFRIMWSLEFSENLLRTSPSMHFKIVIWIKKILVTVVNILPSVSGNVIKYII